MSYISLIKKIETLKLMINLKNHWKFVVRMILKEVNTLIRQGWIELIKRDR